MKPLIWIESVIEKHSHSRIEYMIKVWSLHECMFLMENESDERCPDAFVQL